MRKEKFGASALWQNNNKKFVTKKDVLDLSRFVVMMVSFAPAKLIIK